MQKNSFLIIDGKPDKISKNAVSYQMSLVAFTLYIIINLRKESDKKSENAYCFRNIYVPGLFDTSKNIYVICHFDSIPLYNENTKSDKISLIAYHCNRYLYIYMFLVYLTVNLVIIMTLYLYFIKVKFRKNIQNANIKNVNF